MRLSGIPERSESMRTWVSTIRRALEHGYRALSEKFNPAAALKCFASARKSACHPTRSRSKKPKPSSRRSITTRARHRAITKSSVSSPARVPLRKSREVADCDLTQGKVLVSRARVMRHDKDRTKTGEDRLVELCPRAVTNRLSQRPIWPLACAPSQKPSRAQQRLAMRTWR